MTAGISKLPIDGKCSLKKTTQTPNASISKQNEKMFIFFTSIWIQSVTITSQWHKIKINVFFGIDNVHSDY